MEVFSLQQRAAKTPEEALHKQYRFWNTQPVPKMSMLYLIIYILLHLVKKSTLHLHIFYGSRLCHNYNDHV